MLKNTLNYKNQYMSNLLKAIKNIIINLKKEKEINDTKTQMVLTDYLFWIYQTILELIIIIKLLVLQVEKTLTQYKDRTMQ